MVVGAALPPQLVQGTDEPSDVLWWVFEKIALAVEDDPELSERVRAELDPLEAELFEQGRAGRRELEQRSGADAESYAAEFMVRIAARVEDTARSLLAAVS